LQHADLVPKAGKSAAWARDAMPKIMQTLQARLKAEGLIP
jgi:hypothetical protein